MGHPCGYFLGTSVSKICSFNREFKTKSFFVEGNLSFVEAPWQSFKFTLKYCKNFVSMETLKDIYRSIVEPHLNYCCSVWGCSGITRIESLQKLQNRAARIVTCSSYDAPSEPLRKELGWLSVKEMIVKETSTMMYRSINDLAPQYLSDLFVRLSDFHTRVLRNTKNDLAVPALCQI